MTKLSQRNPFAAAERKGADAAAAGLGESDCPYVDKRVPSGRLSFSRAWRNAWLLGFRRQLNLNRPAQGGS